MKLAKFVKMVAAGAVSGALLLSGAAATPAHAKTYAPQVSSLSVSSTLDKGKASVWLTGTNLTSAVKVTATYGKKSTSSNIAVNKTKTAGSAKLNVGSLLPKTAGKYTVKFTATVKVGRDTATYTTYKTYTVGKSFSFKSIKILKMWYGWKITGKAVKGGKIFITVKIGKRTYTRTVTADKKGEFSWGYPGTTKGKYSISFSFIANKDYFGASTVSKSAKR